MPNENQIIEILKKKLTNKRLNHSLMVAKAARTLAKQYNVNPEKAYKAGLLHDVMKNESRENQLREINLAGIELEDYEFENDKLLHAPAGAAFVINQMDERDNDFINSIRYHTTGREKMSQLEKIVYVADLISTDRTYDDVEIVRQKAKTSLNQAIFYIISFQIAYLAQNSMFIGKNTVNLYNEMLKEFYKLNDK